MHHILLTIAQCNVLHFRDAKISYTILQLSVMNQNDDDKSQFNGSLLSKVLSVHYIGSSERVNQVVSDVLNTACHLDDFDMLCLPSQQHSHNILETHMSAGQMYCSDHSHK